MNSLAQASPADLTSVDKKCLIKQSDNQIELHVGTTFTILHPPFAQYELSYPNPPARKN